MREPNEDQDGSILTPLLQRENLSARSNVASGEGNDAAKVNQNQGSRCATFTSIQEHHENVKSTTTPTPPSTAPMSKWSSLRQGVWTRNGGSVLVIIAMFFGALMSLTTQLLETNKRNGQAMHPFQILFTRMGITSIVCTAYMLYHNIAPLGIKGIRWLLVVRGISGFVGVLGLYYSLLYLTIADATVICFLAPLASCLAYSFLLHEPVTTSEKLAGIFSFLGVIVIARPPLLFGVQPTDNSSVDGTMASRNFSFSPRQTPSADPVTSAERISAIIIGLIGVSGAAVAYVSIRWIGNRAHPLVSVNYLSVLSTIVSAICLFSIPSIGFKLPANALEWILLLSLGFCGFIMQFLVTKGLQSDKAGSRATNMVYTQLLFALAFDYIFLGKTPALSSMVGSILILGSVLYMALHANETKARQDGEARDGDDAGGTQGTFAAEEDPGASAVHSGTYTRAVENQQATNAV